MTLNDIHDLVKSIPHARIRPLGERRIRVNKFCGQELADILEEIRYKTFLAKEKEYRVLYPHWFLEDKDGQINT